MPARSRKPSGSGRTTSSGRTTDSGRTTPKGGGPTPIHPFRKLDPDTPVQVGRRPSSPAFLVVVGLMWVAAGIIAIASLSAGWKFVPGILFIGIGLFFLRGAGATVARREQRQSDG
jgi:hypothetical protein